MMEPVMVSWLLMIERRFSGTSNPVVPPRQSFYTGRTQTGAILPASTKRERPHVLSSGAYKPYSTSIVCKAVESPSASTTLKVS